MAALYWCNSIDLLGVSLSDGTVNAYRWNEMDGTKKDWKRMWLNAPEAPPLPANGPAHSGEASSRLLLWQPDGRAAAVVSSTSLDVLNVESGTEIFHASLAEAGAPVRRVVDGVWLQLAAAADASVGAGEEKELHFTDFLPPIPRFSEGSGAGTGDGNDDDADAVLGDFALSSSSSSPSSLSSKPSLSLIAVLDACGRSRCASNLTTAPAPLALASASPTSHSVPLNSPCAA
jgi:hypothetical protein